MKKIEEVEEARNLMLEAKDWSIWKWLMEKRRVREAADRANEALDKQTRTVKKAWSEELKHAYRELEEADPDHEQHRHSKKVDQSIKISPEIRVLAKKIKQAHDAAYEAHMRAEETFAVAASRLNISMAREGTAQAIESWDLKEKAIRKAEAAARTQSE
jgi:hypothetical protein